MKAALIVALAVISGPALAGPQWTWEAGKQTHNGAITLKSTSGSSTYTGTQNPTGAVAKVNQTAVTQPPTVIIQATSGGAPFNYKDDCWIFDLEGHANQWFIGAGKIDGVNKKFTGIMGYAQGHNHSYHNGGGQVYAALSGGTFAGLNSHGSGNPQWCDNSVSCAWNTAYNVHNVNTFYGHVVMVASLPFLTYKKCYP